MLKLQKELIYAYLLYRELASRTHCCLARPPPQVATPNTVTVLYRYPEVRRMGEVVNVLVAFAVIVFLFRWVTSSAFVASLLKWPSSDLNLAWNR